MGENKLNLFAIIGEQQVKIQLLEAQINALKKQVEEKQDDSIPRKEKQ